MSVPAPTPPVGDQILQATPQLTPADFAALDDRLGNERTQDRVDIDKSTDARFKCAYLNDCDLNVHDYTPDNPLVPPAKADESPEQNPEDQAKDFLTKEFFGDAFDEAKAIVESIMQAIFSGPTDPLDRVPPGDPLQSDNTRGEDAEQRFRDTHVLPPQGP
jgi:hypothetical protein